MRKLIVFLMSPFLFTSLSLSVFMPVSKLYAEEKINIAVDEANPPFMYKDSSGNAAGLYPNLIKAVFKRLGKNIEVNAYPWKRVLDMGSKGQVGIAGIYKNEDRLKIYDYSNQIFEEKIVVYVKNGKPFPFKDVADLRNKTVGTIQGWSYGDEFDKGKNKLFKVEENVSDELNIKKIDSDRIDCVVAVEQSGDAAITKLALQKKIAKLETPLAINPTFLVFAKTLNRQGLVSQFNVTLEAMKKDGSYQTLIKSNF